jgi:exosortase D (VPLPA-CTERM-specific)
MQTRTAADHLNGGPARYLSWIPWLVLLAALGVAFYGGLANMTDDWSREEYSHGYLIPFIAAYMVWRVRAQLVAQQWGGTWAGVAVIAGGMFLLVLGELSTLYIIIQYAFLLTLAGLVLALAGWSVLRLVAAPLIYLFFMIPLPNFFYNTLSQKLQLLSSAIGVAFMRLFDVTVFLEGNVIDLGVYQLQVVDACSGLRYLFPLMSFGFLCAYLFKAPFWQRALVFLSAIPITVLMNSFRVGIIGILVNSYGTAQAEGFLHYFEGWVIFMSCVALLLGEMWLLTRLTQRGSSFREIFNVDFGRPVHPEARSRWLPPRHSLATAAIGMIVVTAVGLQFITHREEIIPERARFSAFPDDLDAWRGQAQALPPAILRGLDLDDYLLTNYARPDERLPVNMYVAYYSSQRKGASIHSPRSCLPGHDWEIVSLTTRRIPDVDAGGTPLAVNRVLISQGQARQLVYYWFEQRGRRLTSEYAVKWYLLWDAIELNRTDGALVRFTTPIPPGTSIEASEKRMQDFLRLAYPKLEPYIPT